MKAEALASGKVESLNIAHRNTDAAGQLEDIRNLIQAGVQEPSLQTDTLWDKETAGRNLRRQVKGGSNLRFSPKTGL